MALGGRAILWPALPEPWDMSNKSFSSPTWRGFRRGFGFSMLRLLRILQHSSDDIGNVATRVIAIGMPVEGTASRFTHQSAATRTTERSGFPLTLCHSILLLGKSQNCIKRYNYVNRYNITKDTWIDAVCGEVTLSRCGMACGAGLTSTTRHTTP